MSEWLLRLRDKGFPIMAATHAIAGLSEGVTHLHVEPRSNPQLPEVETIALRS